MKRSFTLLLCLLIAVSCFASCIPSTCESTGHSYYDTWTSDAENHWHAASCGHVAETADKAAHTGMDDDGICDVCKWADTSFVPPVEHSHTFGTTWTSDESGHWNAASCEHTTEKGNFAAHVLVNGYSGCVICGYGHEHTYADAWSSDADNHWHAPVCGHEVENADVAAHVDENNDGACDECGYDADHEHTFSEEWLITEVGHYHPATCGHDVLGDWSNHIDMSDPENLVYADGICDVCGANIHHSYSEEWSANATHHYHLADCGCALVPADYEAHVDANNDGECDVCESYLNDFSEAIADATSDESAAKVNKSTVTTAFGDIVVDFGVDFVKIDDGYSDTVNWYIPYVDNDGVTRILAVHQQEKNLYDDNWNVIGTEIYYARNTYANANLYYGYNFPATGLDAYGVEALVDAVYAMLSDEELTDSIYGISYGYEQGEATKTYTVSFGYDNGSALEIYNLSVTVDNTSGAITSAQITVQTHYNYYVSEALDVYYGLNGDPSVYNYSIVQVVGERTATCEHDKSDYLLEGVSFELDNGDGTYTAVTDGMTIEAVVGYSNPVLLDPQGKLPEDASSYINIKVYLDEAKTEEAQAYTHYGTPWGKVGLYFQKGGTYYVTITTDFNTFNLVFDVSWQIPTYITPSVSEVDTFTGVDVELSASLPSGCEPSYTASLVGENAANATLVLDSLGQNYIFNSNVPGTYTVQYTATAATDVTATTTIVVEQAPTLEELISGSYKYEYSDWWNSYYYVVTFNPSEDSVLVGTAILYDSADSDGVEVNYVFDEDSYEFAFTPVDSDDDVSFGVAIISYKVTVLYSNSWGESYEEAMDSYTPPAPKVPENVIKVTTTADNASYTVSFTAPVAGKYTFNLPEGVTTTDTVAGVALEAAATYSFNLTVATAGDYEITYGVEVTAPITVTVTDTYGYFDFFTFTAALEGDYTFTVPAGLGVMSAAAYETYGNPYVDFYDGGGEFTLSLYKNETVTLYVGSATATGDYNLTYMYGEIVEVEEEESYAALSLGTQTVAIEDGGTTFTFTATEDGQYMISGMMVAFSATLDGETVAFDQGITLSAGDVVIVTVTGNLGANNYNVSITKA